VPLQGFGFAAQSYWPSGVYLAGGLSDANGQGNKLDFSTVKDQGEFFTWLEFGFRPGFSYTSGTNLHVHYWHQDKTVLQGFTESWGLNLNYSKVFGTITPFLRAGYAEGTAPFMRRFVGGGATFVLAGRDNLGVATSWGSPPDKTLRDQYTSEIFYRFQLTQRLTVTPNLQWTVKPSYDTEQDHLAVVSLRIRVVF